MTTGRINQVARPRRRAGTGSRARRPSRGAATAAAGPTVVSPKGLGEERGTEGPRACSVSSIRDQERARGGLGDAGLGGRYHEATPRALSGRRVVPGGHARRRQHVRKPTSRRTGSITQALVNGAGTVPARLKGHGAGSRPHNGGGPAGRHGSITTHAPA